MSVLFSPNDQPDLSNAPPAVDFQELYLQRDMNHAHAGNVMRMLEGVRSGHPTWDGAVLRTTLAGARNMLEASLASLNAVEAECRHHLAGRERVIEFSRIPPVAKPFGRRVPDSALPAVVSTGSL